MDPSLVASFRKNLEGTPTEEIRQAFEGLGNSSRTPEELEAMRLTLDERRAKGNRFTLALGSALVVGSLVAACAWWQGVPGGIVVLAGVVGAILGFASFYIPGLISQT